MKNLLLVLLFVPLVSFGQTVTYKDAYTFMKQRSIDVNQKVLKGFETEMEGTKMYFFFSVPNEMNGFACVSAISEYKLDVFNVDCGKFSIKQTQWLAIGAPPLYSSEQFYWTNPEEEKERLEKAKRERGQREKRLRKEDAKKIENYKLLSQNFKKNEKQDALITLLASLENDYPDLNQELNNINTEIDNEKIANYRKLSANFNSIEKQKVLKELLSTLENDYPDLNQELNLINNKIQIEKIDLFIKKNDLKSAREFVKKMDKKHITDEILHKVYPHYKILKMVYDDIVKAEDYNNIGNNANVYILLYLLNYSSIEFKNAKWFKGAFGTSRLVLMGTDNKLYGGLGWRQAAGLQFKLEKISSSSLSKIKNSLISQVPLYKQERSGMKTESYVDKDDLTGVEYIFGRKISDYISPNDFYKILATKTKNSKGYPSGALLKARYNE